MSFDDDLGFFGNLSLAMATINFLTPANEDEDDEDDVVRQPVTYCEKCGYQLFRNDKECGYCHYPVIKKQK